MDEGSIHYIVMELIEGITLKSYITKKGRLSSKEAIGIAIQVLRELQLHTISTLSTATLSPRT